MRRHWTPDRIKKRGITPISEEERARIKSAFSIDVDGYFNSVKCPRCGHEYGVYEFIQQGVEEHGIEAVKAVFSAIDVSIVRVNPKQVAVCVNCKLPIVFGSEGGFYYSCNQGYGCCEP